MNTLNPAISLLNLHHLRYSLSIASLLLIATLFNATIATAQEDEVLTYTVKAGDTLYSISRSFGVDYHEVAEINDIGPDFAINPGQVLILKGDLAPPTTATPRAKDRGPSPTQWLWPTKSDDVLSRFAQGVGTSSQGVDIAGTMNQLILATASGKVIYAGRGMYRDYGNLIILNHGGRYSSVYGHSSEMLVKEGQEVDAGQPIARMGSTGTDRVKLHFQIRRSGEALDPLKLLLNR